MTGTQSGLSKCLLPKIYLIVIDGLLHLNSCDSFESTEMNLLLASLFEEFPWCLVARHTEKCQSFQQDMDQILVLVSVLVTQSCLTLQPHGL